MQYDLSMNIQIWIQTLVNSSEDNSQTNYNSQTNRKQLLCGTAINDSSCNNCDGYKSKNL